jgi:hypothetical protein
MLCVLIICLPSRLKIKNMGEGVVFILLTEEKWENMYENMQHNITYTTRVEHFP